MNIDISPELVRSYFHDKCTAAEKKEVENWLKSGEANYQMAMRWLKEEESDEDEKFLASLLVAEDDILKSTEEILGQLKDEKGIHRLNNAGKKGSLHDGKKTRKLWYVRAATISVILFSAWAVKNYIDSRVTTLTTAFEQTLKIVLPDSSVAILNGNSSLSYRSSVFEKEREIWMEGEAFFDVNHLPDNARFMVHLSDDKTVEVLGTEFNVSERKNLSKIVLKSGKIRLDIPKSQENIEMAPGEMVEVDSFDGSIKREHVNSEIYYSWIHGKWKFDSTTLSEILRRLEETHGVKVNVYDTSLLSRKVSGTIPLQGNSHALIANIANAFDLKIESQKTKLYLKERNR